MKNLGKIVLLIFLFLYALFGTIRATVDSTTVEHGEMITYSLNISGEDIERPNIHTLCDSDVISTSSQTSIEMINGDYRKSYILSYKFLPQKSCEIKPIELEIDGKQVKSNSVQVTVSAVVPSKDSEFELSLKSSKEEVFVGETFELTLLFKQKKGAEAVDSKFIPSAMKGFWVKDESKPIRYAEKNYTITKIIYTMAAQRAGELKVTQAQMRIASRSHTRDSWGAWVPKIKWKSYFSKELSIDVKALPNGVDLIGNFSIAATVDKTEINVNEAVNVNIKILGVGNLEDIKSFKPFINGVSIFDEKIVINKTQLNQKLAFVAEEDFRVPSFTLKYFDTISQEIKTIKTKSIAIKVKNAKKKEELIIKRETPTQESVKPTLSSNTEAISYSFVIVALLIGFGLGVVLMLFKPWHFIKKREKSVSIKEPKILLVKLLPFKEDVEVQEIINILENNLYSSEKKELDKKKVKEILIKYEI